MWQTFHGIMFLRLENFILEILRTKKTKTDHFK